MLAYATLDRTGGAAAHRYCETTGTLAWLAAHVLGDQHAVGQPPLDQLIRAVAGLDPRLAAPMIRWVDEQDQLVRGLLGLGDDRQLLPGAICPACGCSALAIRTSGRPPSWVVECTLRCSCEGDVCRCGMTERTVGAQHVWPIDALRKGEAVEARQTGQSTA